MDAMNNVRIIQQEDRRWTLAWEDAEGKTQQRTDFPNPEEAAKVRDDLRGYSQVGSDVGQ